VLELVVRRWPLKILALALAFAVWIAVTGEGRSVSDLHVPVDVLLPDDATLSGMPPPAVTVRLRGPEPLLRRLDAYDLDVRIDLREAASGDHTVQLTPQNVSGVPRDLEITMIDPERLRFTVARKKRRDVPVIPAIVGQPPRGYFVYGSVARPEGLEVEGPETKLTSATRLRTDPIRVDERRQAFTVRVGALPDGADLRVVDPRPLDVTVYVDLAPVEAVIAGVPVVVPGDGALTSPSVISVTVMAPPGLIARLKDGHIRAVAEAPSAGVSGTMLAVPIRIEFPGLDDDDRATVSVKSVSRRVVDLRPERR
jgi:YbbR domain-containing protein